MLNKEDFFFFLPTAYAAAGYDLVMWEGGEKSCPASAIDSEGERARLYLLIQNRKELIRSCEAVGGGGVACCIICSVTLVRERWITANRSLHSEGRRGQG